MNTVIMDNNDCMKLFENFNKLQSGLLLSYIFCSVLIMGTELLNLLSSAVNADFEQAVYNFINLFSVLTAYVACYFLTVSLTDGKKWLKGFWGIVCLAFFQTAFKCVYDTEVFFVSGILIAFVLSYFFNRFSVSVSLSVTIVFSIIFGLLAGYLFEYFENFLMTLAQMISGKGIASSILFSAADSFFTLFGIHNFRDLFFFKSYGGSQLIESSVITGVKDLFEAGYTGELISTYLSGHYYLLFAVGGICIAMLNKLKHPQKTVLIILLVSSLFSGNLTLIFLFLFLQSPFLFLSVFFISALSFLSAQLLNLNIGYIYNGGIVEMIMYSKNYIYLIAGSVVFFAIGYFVFKFTYEKHGISDCVNVYIPSRLNSMVEALGGIGNIIRFKDDALEVRNPKLINTVKFDCEIDENIVKSNSEKFIELKEYLI